MGYFRQSAYNGAPHISTLGGPREVSSNFEKWQTGAVMGPVPCVPSSLFWIYTALHYTTLQFCLCLSVNNIFLCKKTTPLWYVAYKQILCDKMLLLILALIGSTWVHLIANRPQQGRDADQF